MSQDKPIKELINVSLENLRSLIDVNTIIGDPITTSGGITIIPYSKVTFGYAGGGADLNAQTNDRFAGGSGAGVTINPLGFIVISGGDVKLLQTSAGADKGDRLVDAGVGIADRIFDLFPKKSNKTNIAADLKNDSTIEIDMD